MNFGGWKFFCGKTEEKKLSEGRDNRGGNDAIYADALVRLTLSIGLWTWRKDPVVQ
jgi:hypothetical protein